MINARVPLFVLRVIGNFYSKLSGLVSGKSLFSSEFKIRSDTRQGRGGGGGGGSWILSAVLYNLYITDLICSLRDSGNGYEIGSEYCGVVNYADDIVLISDSIIKMQFMLDFCYCYGCQHDIVFNGKKSHWSMFRK